MIPARSKGTFGKERAISYFQQIGFDISRSKGYEPYDFILELDGIKHGVIVRYGKMLHFDTERIMRILNKNLNPAFFLISREGQYIFFINKELGVNKNARS